MDFNAEGLVGVGRWGKALHGLRHEFAEVRRVCVFEKLLQKLILVGVRGGDLVGRTLAVVVVLDARLANVLHEEPEHILLELLLLQVLVHHFQVPLPQVELLHFSSDLFYHASELLLNNATNDCSHF